MSARPGAFRSETAEIVRRIAPYLPPLVILACVTARSTREWGDFGGYAIAGAAFRVGRYANDASNNWPPFFSLLAVPLSLLDTLPVRLGRMVWALLGCGAFALTAARFFSKVRSSAVPFWAVPVATMLVAPFWGAHILHHQVYVFVFAACAEGFFAADRGRDLRAGIWIGVAAATKVTPAFTLAYFLFARRLRVVVAAVAAALCCSLLTIPVLGAQGAIDAHRRWIARAVSLHGTFADRNQSLEALILRWTVRGKSPDVAWLGPIVPLSTEAAQTVGGLASAALIAVAAALSGLRGLPPAEAFASMIAVSTFAAPYCWRSQMIALFPLLLVLLSRIATRRSDRIDVAALSIFAVAALLREPGIAGPQLYALLEGAGLTAITYLLILANALRGARTLSPLGPGWVREASMRSGNNTKGPVAGALFLLPNRWRRGRDSNPPMPFGTPHFEKGVGRVAPPFGFALKDPSLRLSRARLFPLRGGSHRPPRSVSSRLPPTEGRRE